jgi:acetoin utilization protein AcuB
MDGGSTTYGSKEETMRLWEIMSTSVKTATVGETAEQAYGRMLSGGFRHLVVMDGGRVVGVVSSRDLGGRGGAALRKGRSVGDVMAPHVITAQPDTTVREAANTLRGHTIGCLPVLEGKKLKGIVTVTDLLELLGRGAGTAGPRRRTIDRLAVQRRSPQRGAGAA